MKVLAYRIFCKQIDAVREYNQTALLLENPDKVHLLCDPRAVNPKDASPIKDVKQITYTVEDEDAKTGETVKVEIVEDDTDNSQDKENK